MNDTPICPCEGFVHPKVICNPPGRDVIAYSVGDYAAFRHALLLPLKNEQGQLKETELTNWRPSAKGDLALQMVEWWAYLADILTFYNERSANQAYLRTADLLESLQRLIRLLGYRPRPGIGATGVLAALMSRPTSFMLPKGFPIQSKPGPGKQPQVFELNGDTRVSFPDAVDADPPADPLLLKDGGVLLKGTIATVKKGGRLLILKKDWSGSELDYALATVKEVKQEKDPRGNTNTRVIFNEPLDALSGTQAKAKDYRLLKSSQSSHLYQYPTNHVIWTDHIHLEAIKGQVSALIEHLFDIEVTKFQR